MADWGLYSALRGTDDWAQKRQDQQMNLLAAEKSEAREQKKVAESAAAEADIAKYMEELQNLEVLPEDQERVAAAEKQARQNIVAGIAKNNGDLRRYMSTGGITALNEYKTSVMQSEEVKQAGVNKINLTNYLNQDAKGNQRHKFVDVDVPMFDEEGNQIGSETKKMSFQDQYDLYKQGKIKNLNYDGSETRINMGIEDFNRMYKNPADPYQEDNYVTASNIYEKMLSKGASEEYAREQANRYADMYAKGGDAWRWNAKDKTALAVEMAKIKAKKNKAQQEQDAFNRFKNKGMLTHDVPTALKSLTSEGMSHDMGPREVEFWQKSLQIQNNDTKGNYFPTGVMAKNAIAMDDVDLSNMQNVYFDKIIAKKGKDGKVNRYIEAQVTLPDQTNWVTSFGDWNNLPITDVAGMTFVKKANEKNWQTDMSGNANGTVLIPIDKQLSQATFLTQMDKYIGNTTAALWTAASTTNESNMQEALIDLEYLKSKGLFQTQAEYDQALIDIQQGTFDDVDKYNARTGISE